MTYDALRSRADPGDKDTLHWLLWRQGTGGDYRRCIYAQVLDYASGSDVILGWMDTPLLAAEVVDDHNARLRQTMENMEDEAMGERR